MRGAANVTLLQVYHISVPCDTTLWTRIVFTRVLFRLHVLSTMDGKIKQCVCIKFSVKLGKSTTETLEMLREAFWEHSLSRTTVFEWHSRSKAGHVSWRWQTFRVTNSRAHQQRQSLNNPWACRHHWDQLCSLPGDLNRKLEHAPHCSFITTTHPPTRPWKPQSFWLTAT
jgi:hypothetical protein